MEAARDRRRRTVPASRPLSTNPHRPTRVIYTVVGRAPLRDKHVGAAAFASGGAPVDAQKSPEISAAAPSEKCPSCGLLLAPGTGDSTTVYVAGRRSIHHPGTGRTPWTFMPSSNASVESSTKCRGCGSLRNRRRVSGGWNGGRAKRSSAVSLTPRSSAGRPEPSSARPPEKSASATEPDKFVGGTEGPDTTAGRESGVPCDTRQPPRPRDARAGRGTPGPRPFFYRSTSNIRENLITSERSVRCGRSKRS